MLRRLALLAVLTAAAAGCGKSASSTTATVPPGTTGSSRTVPISPPPTTLTVFRVVDGALHAETARVPYTTAVASSALGALDLAAPVHIDGGTAVVDLPTAAPDAVAEIVYTLTQYRSVQRVDVGGRTGLTRDDVLTFVPPILVESPGAGATVLPTFRVSGTASVFEATLVVELRDGSKVLQKKTATASEGAPGRGTFALDLTAPGAGSYTVAAFAPSAADGTPQHEQDIPVVVGSTP